MKENIKNFCVRGMLFGGFGPIIASIVYFIISMVDKTVVISGKELFIMILSTYLLAFIHAGTSIFHQMDISVIKAMGLQLLFLYIAYLICYIINSWLPFDWNVILIFTSIFVGGYLIIWLIVYLIVRKSVNKLNEKIVN